MYILTFQNAQGVGIKYYDGKMETAVDRYGIAKHYLGV